MGAAFPPASTERERWRAGSRDLIDMDNTMDSNRNLARMFHELQSRDREDGLATGQPQGVGPEAYLNGTSQGATPEDARKDAHIRGRSM